MASIETDIEESGVMIFSRINSSISLVISVALERDVLNPHEVWPSCLDTVSGPGGGRKYLATFKTPSNITRGETQTVETAEVSHPCVVCPDQDQCEIIEVSPPNMLHGHWHAVDVRDHPPQVRRW
jgi:hypothetical protein